MSTKALQKNLEYCEKTLTLKSALEEGFVALGERLGRIRDEELYKPQWSTFAEFLEEMKLSEATASKMISIYQKFVIGFGIAPEKIALAGGWNPAYEISTFAQTKKEAVEWLEKSSTLTRQDLRKELQERKSGIPMKECKHKDTYTIKICRDCGEREKINED